MAIRFHISEWMGKNKMTQKQLADLTNIRPATISAIYHDQIKRIDVEHINKLCEVFNCQPGDLLSHVPNND